MTNLISRVLSYQIGPDTSLSQLISFFCSSSGQPTDDILPYVQHQVIREIKRRLLRAGDSEQETCLQNLVSELTLSLCQKQWHCGPGYHQLWLKTILCVLVPDSQSSNDDGSLEDLQLFFVNNVLPELITEHSFLLESLFLISICSDHCQCNSVKLVLKLNQLLVNFDLIERYSAKLNRAETFQRFFSQIRNNQSCRCLPYEFLQLCIEVSKLKKSRNHELIAYLTDLITSSSLLDSLLPYFHISRNFAGPRSPSDLSPPIQDKSIEYACDCVLIRSYILVYLRIIESCANKDLAKRQFLSQVAQIKSNLSYDEPLTEWLIQVFITEDSELFEMLYLCVILCAPDDSNQVILVHSLFTCFLVDIYHDASTLLEMLTTDSSTATNLLKFLLSYLKLPHDNRDRSKAKLFLELKQKIIRLHRKGLFPYNPNALIRLLNQF